MRRAIFRTVLFAAMAFSGLACHGPNDVAIDVDAAKLQPTATSPAEPADLVRVPGVVEHCDMPAVNTATMPGGGATAYFRVAYGWAVPTRRDVTVIRYHFDANTADFKPGTRATLLFTQDGRFRGIRNTVR